MTAEAAPFPVHWDDPADAQVTWRYDREHMPNAVAPLEFELGIKGFLEGFGWGMEPRQFNYFIYFALRGVPDGQAPPPPTPGSVREGARRWRDEVLPEVLAYTKHYRETDFASLTNEQLVDEVGRLRELRFRAGQLHTLAIMPHWQGMTILNDTYRELTGGDDLGAQRLVQGHPNKSFESGEGLWQVAAVARDIPSARERLLAIEAPTALDTLAALRSDAAAAPFIEAFDGYLEAYGWRTNLSFGSPTWFEDPSVPLSLLRAYLETDGYDPREEHRRLVEEREAAVRDTMASLGEDGRARLQDALDAAVAVAPQLEDHNFFIDQRLASTPRRFVLEAGARIGLPKPNDVFFLHADELCAALRNDLGGVAQLTETRKGEFKRWRTVTPPRFLGVVPPGESASAPQPATRPEHVSELRGTGVSAGVARGPARILNGLNEAGRLRPGDVLVTSVTQPAWTPLFAVARAIVTEVGGMLSHTGVAAREFRLPAVAAVPDARRLLRDGQLIEVDGSAGTVRVIS